MEIRDLDKYYTKEDLDNLTLHHCDNMEKEDKYVLASVGLSVILITIILITMKSFSILSIVVDAYFIIFAFVAISIMKGAKKAEMKWYIEVEVLEKQEKMTKPHYDIQGRVDVNDFFHIIGKDSKSGSETTVYMIEEQWNNTNVGDFIKVEINKNTAKLMENRR